MEVVHPKDLDHRILAESLLEEQPLLGEKIAMAVYSGEQQAAEHLTEVLRFLHLTVWSGKTLTPPLPIDLAWHEFILFTRAYLNFCERVFGRIVHHQPGGSEKENQSQLRQTLKLYQLCFGPPPVACWGDQGYLGTGAECGACETE